MSRLNEFSPSSSWTVTHGRYRDNNLPPPVVDGQLGWRRRPTYDDHSRVGTQAAEFRPFEERIPVRHFSEPSVNRSRFVDRHPSTHILFFNNDMSRRVYPRPPPFRPWLTSRHHGEANTQTPAQMDESKLTKEEQEMALRKLKKQIYYPPPKIMAKQVNLHYREPYRNLNASASNNCKHKDEDGKKSCAICLEDFEPREEVLLTPCNHMFHEVCIVPWVKSHGKCPVCRFTLFERIRANCPAALNNRGQVLQAEHGLFVDELISLFRAVDEAFVRGF